jgi:hypothetical protein
MRSLPGSRPRGKFSWIVSAAGAVNALLCANLLCGQTPSPARRFASPHPGNLGSPSPTPARSTPPPYDVALRQERWEQLADHAISPDGEKALPLRPEHWRHGETENFILHYRSLSDALQIAREIEFDLWYVAQTLGATPPQYSRKSHVYVFQDEKEWQRFLAETQTPTWVHSFSVADELFLDVRVQGGFDSHTLAHETTHAIVARFYGNRTWPLWLNEGFAEYMGDASVAARHWRLPLSNQRKLKFAEMTVADLIATTHYPAEPRQVARLYATGAKFVRYLFNKYPRELFPRLLDRVLDGQAPESALIEIYGNEFSDMAEFEKRFARFIR